MKTKQVVDVYNVLCGAKLSKMEDKDKFIVIKAMRQLKPVAVSYEDEMKDAREKLKDDRFDDMQALAKDWEKKYGRNARISDLPAGEVGKLEEINGYFMAYQHNVDKYAEELLAKDNELSYGRLSEEAFGKLVSSNDFDVQTIMDLQDALMN